jgi:hypothetical protein
MTPENGPERPQLPLRWPAGEPGGQAVSRDRADSAGTRTGDPGAFAGRPGSGGAGRDDDPSAPGGPLRLSIAPEFASEIVQLGLAAFEREAKQPLPATAGGRGSPGNVSGARYGGPPADTPGPGGVLLALLELLALSGLHGALSSLGLIA